MLPDSLMWSSISNCNRIEKVETDSVAGNQNINEFCSGYYPENHFTMNNKSRQLAYLLRHDDSYHLEAGGWREIDDLIANHQFSHSEICAIVAADTKGRYEINADLTKVRALYGHSVKVDLMLQSSEPPKILFHGSAMKYIESIHQNGLKPKSRQFVHLTEDRDLAIKTGSRHGEPVLLTIDSIAMYNNGYEFFRINNGLWLTKEVPVNYIAFND